MMINALIPLMLVHINVIAKPKTLIQITFVPIKNNKPDNGRVFKLYMLGNKKSKQPADTALNSTN